MMVPWFSWAFPAQNMGATNRSPPIGECFRILYNNKEI